MSNLYTNNIFSRGGVSTPILQSTGNIVQSSRVRYDSRTTWSSNNSGNGNEITPLRLSISPRHSGNIILCQWVLSGDFHHDNVFLVFRDDGKTPIGGIGVNPTDVMHPELKTVCTPGKDFKVLFFVDPDSSDSLLTQAYNHLKTTDYYKDAKMD